MYNTPACFLLTAAARVMKYTISALSKCLQLDIFVRLD